MSVDKWEKNDKFISPMKRKFSVADDFDQNVDDFVHNNIFHRQSSSPASALVFF